MKQKISAVISVHNGEEKLDKCLKSLKFCNEIVVVDHESTDKTLEIAKKYTKKIFSQKNDPLSIDLQKNYGFTKATSEWILSIDADEEVSDELGHEIEHLLGDDLRNIDGFYIPRKNFIFGKWIEHSGWYPDLQLRLFRKEKGRFTKKHVHEQLELDGKSSALKEHLIHSNYSSIDQFIKKTIQYAPNEAEEIIKNKYNFTHLDVIRFPIREFLSRFFAREGYKDGIHGLVLSIFMAFYHFLIFVYIWEKRGFKEYEGNNLLKETGVELKNINKEVGYWINKIKIDEEKNPIKKNLQKALRKLKK